MFDGLKKKLNSFREDVEETAEEKAEEAEEAERAKKADAVDAAETGEAVDETDSADTASDTDAVDADPVAEQEADSTAEPEPDTADVEDGVSAESDAAASTETLVDEERDVESAAEPAEAVASAQDTSPEELDDSEASEPSETSADADDEEENEIPEFARRHSSSDDGETDEKQSSTSRWQQMKSMATGRIIIEEEDLEGPLWTLEMALLESDVEMNVAERMLDTIRDSMIGESRKQVDTTAELVQEALYDALLDVISVGQFDFDERLRQADKPVVIIFTGVNGVGKTTSIAKMTEYLEKQGLSSVMANGDTYRAGANEQIRKHAENLDRKLIAHEQGGDPAAVIYDAVEYAEAHDIDVVLGDTAGRLHTSNDLMAQLEKINRVVEPDMTLFVDEAVAGQDAVQRAKKFDEAAEIDGAILTKADADSQGGAAISIAYVTGKPILFLGTGQGYDDMERFDPEELVSSLLADEE
ncbi:signal recognition particle-docking protein FtsY [Halogranum rubrum]|uniref:Signal recognition particle receptor FtsY n=1 Tax=Halogranum salarium B-1 TaxID=1210908 RepID=J3JG45_9EURY|nr:signal recognition particle-docking protein FtsY [Halogranum salarium]EJN59814.1 signal recognition particle-docking protein ftsy [Halogranum salarium B-1]